MNEPEKIYKLHTALVNSEFQSFPIQGNVSVSDKQGVYIIYNGYNIALHVGKTDRADGGLDQRLNNHLHNQSSFSKKYVKPKNINMRNGCKFRYLEVPDARDRTLLEALTTGLLCPAHIGTGEKKK